MKKLLLAGLAIGAAFQMGWIGDSSPELPEFAAAYDDKVVLYATDWCGYCAKTRELLAENEIPYTEYDIEKSAQGKSEYDQLNGQGIPLLLIDGDVVRGYRANDILRLADNI